MIADAGGKGARLAGSVAETVRPGWWHAWSTSVRRWCGAKKSRQQPLDREGWSVPSQWRRCDTCRKVLQVSEFSSPEPTATTCLNCQRPRRARTTPRRSTSRQGAAAPAAAEKATPAAQPRRGLRGHGDPEVRRARARRRAQHELAEAFPEDFSALVAEGARSGRGRAAAWAALAEVHPEEYSRLLDVAETDEGLNGFRG
jgi:hypothetical protein